MALVVVVLVAAGALGLATAGSGQTAVSGARTLHYEYVVNDGAVFVYDIDRANRLVTRLVIPQIVDSHGAVASPRTGMLYVSYGGQGEASGNGSLLAYDLRGRRVVWARDYPTGIDSMAITPDGRTIYMPVGEKAYDSNTWSIVEAATGKVTGSISAGHSPHNTIMGRDGKYVYLGGCGDAYLGVASTATNTLVRKIGPLHGPGVRPFTINGSQTLAFTTARTFLGFQVSSITTGKVLFSVAPPGFSFDPQSFGDSTPNHGISLSPNERQLYLIDTPNGYVHVFDVSGLPASAPRSIANIKMKHPPPSDGWLQHSRDGRYVYVGRAGDVIDTKTRKIVAFLPPLQKTADFLEIDWRNAKPVATTSRYGVGYITKPR